MPGKLVLQDILHPRKSGIPLNLFQENGDSQEIWHPPTWQHPCMPIILGYPAPPAHYPRTSCTPQPRIKIKFNASLLYVHQVIITYVHSKKIKFNASIMLMHRLILSRFVISVVSYIFLCTPDNSSMQYLFHWLFLHSNSGTTENMFHIQPCYGETQASCMCNTLGQWQFFTPKDALIQVVLRRVTSSCFARAASINRKAVVFMWNLGMQLSTFAITVPTGSCRLVLFLTVLSLPRSTKRDAIHTSTSVTLKVHSAALPAIFKASVLQYRSAFQSSNLIGQVRVGLGLGKG